MLKEMRSRTPFPSDTQNRGPINIAQLCLELNACNAGMLKDGLQNN